MSSTDKDLNLTVNTNISANVTTNNNNITITNNRINKIMCHLLPSESSDLNLTGWGYKDTEFTINSKQEIEISGKRYEQSGKILYKLKQWLKDNFDIDFNKLKESQDLSKLEIPKSIINPEFINELERLNVNKTTDSYQRILHAHGHSCQEIYQLKWGSFDRFPDLIIFPENHESIEKIVSLSVKYNVLLIPYGGGTNVSQALMCDKNEKRMIISVDMKNMNKLKWIDTENRLACIEAGAVGTNIENELSKYGFCLGHEPDSMEFSTLGGWISTKASGMKQNIYGNIEDIVEKIKLVTPIGTFEQPMNGGRVSHGPNFQHSIIGSEGTYGIITEAIVRITPNPKTKSYGAIVFPNFELGFKCLTELSKLTSCKPSSFRLVDNSQFQFGQSMATDVSYWKEFTEKAKKIYLTKWKKFDVNSMAAAIFIFEGNKEHVEIQKNILITLANKYGGIDAGETAGKRSYFLTFTIAYFRDLAMKFGFLAESFETFVPYHNVLSLCDNLKKNILELCKKENIKTNPWVSFRISQYYATGVCIYIYFGLPTEGLLDPSKTFSHIEEEAREIILKFEGSLSHHHGIGQLRKPWINKIHNDLGIKILKNTKSFLDPNNNIGANNLTS
jgi:alkyldihydroxyacetonephosphate synthase